MNYFSARDAKGLSLILPGSPEDEAALKSILKQVIAAANKGEFSVLISYEELKSPVKAENVIQKLQALGYKYFRRFRQDSVHDDYLITWYDA